MTRSVLSLLIIEDEPILARNIANYLRRYGHEVHTASSAEAGLSKLATFKPDAILLDFNLPGMNGVDALVEIRDIDLQIKVIMMTAEGNDELAVKAMRGGACSFCKKPISLGQLRTILEEAVFNEPPNQALV